MSLIECKCPNCGAEVKINPSEEASYCEYCGKAFITEKAINVNGDYVKGNKIVNNAKQDNENTRDIQISDNKTMIFVMLVFLIMFIIIHFFG